MAQLSAILAAAACTCMQRCTSQPHIIGAGALLGGHYCLLLFQAESWPNWKDEFKL